MANSTTSSGSGHPILLGTLRVVIAFFFAVYITFLVVSILAGSLGGALLFVPAVAFGLASILALAWVHRRPALGRNVLFGGVLLLFAATGWYSFHVMYKFIQPTVLPKKVVSDGAPWKIESQIFSTNDYNNPVVIQLSDGSYRMYFHDRDDMMEAKSANGKTFSAPVKLFTGQMPSVLKTANGSAWRMYYFVNAPTTQPAMTQPRPMQNCGDNCHGAAHELVSAVSTDGHHWTQEPGVRLSTLPNANGYDRDTMIHPSAVRLPNGTYKLYYDGEVDPTSSLALEARYRKIMSASSPDGLTWTKDPGYRIDEKPMHTWEAYSPKAMVVNGKVVLRFTTPNGIYHADSSDGMHFTVGKNPIFSPGRIPMPTDNGALNSYQDAYVLSVPGGQRMYFWIDGKGIWSAFQPG